MIVCPTSYFWVSFLIKSAADEPRADLMVLRTSSKKVFTFFLEGLMRRFPSGYLLHYRTAFASSLMSHPHRHGPILRRTFPSTEERYGFTLFH